MSYPLNILKEKFEKLPEKLQEAIMSIKSNKKLEEIIEKNNIHIDKSAELMDEIGLTMLGMKKPANFRDNIKKRLDISKEKANEITKDVDEEIFAPIKDSFMEKNTEAHKKNSLKDSIPKKISFDNSNKNFPKTERVEKVDVKKLDFSSIENKERQSIEKNTEEKNEILKEIENPQPTDMTFKKDTPVEKVEKLGELKETPAQEKEEFLRQKDNVKKPNFNYEEKEEKQFIEKTEKKDVLDRNLMTENKTTEKEVYKDKDPYLEPID